MQIPKSKLFDDLLYSKQEFDWKSKTFSPKRKGRVGMYALDALAIAFHAMEHEKRIDYICGLGGDAEVNGVIVGALIGS